VRKRNRAANLCQSDAGQVSLIVWKSLQYEVPKPSKGRTTLLVVVVVVLLSLFCGWEGKRR